MTALTELQRAERNAVMWFAEILQRKLYRQLGYGSIHHYATDALGFSKGKTSQFIRLSESLRSLPELKRAVASGEVAWTKAREVATVATRGSESRWVELARTSSRRELERRIAESKAVTRVAVRTDAAQTSLVGAGSDGRHPGSAVGPHSIGPHMVGPDAVGSHGVGPNTDGADAPSPSLDIGSVPISTSMSVQLRFTPEQFARFEALVALARQRGWRGSREELVLGALEGLEETRMPTEDRPGDGDLAAADGGDGMSGRRHPSARGKATPRNADAASPVVQRSPYQVVVYRCESCGKGHVPTSRGDRALDLATLRTIVCDSEIMGKGKRLRASVSPGKRRAVLERDGHRCRAAGCRHTRSLHIHHLVPLEFGGTDDVTNLITLCRECHTWVHERRERLQAAITGDQVEGVRLG